MRRQAIVAAAAVLVLTGCVSPAEGPDASPGPSLSASPTTPEPQPDPTTTTEPTVEPTEEPTTEPSAPAEPSPTAGASEWPPAAEVVHGSPMWAAYVAVVSSMDDPAWAQAQARLTELGYFAGGGDLGCDQGAAEALGVDQFSYGMAVYFDTQADAERFAELYGPELVGIAEVTIYCAD